MSETKKDENDFGSQAEELNPSWSEEIHLKGADTGHAVVSQLVENLTETVDGSQQYNMRHEKRGKAIIFNNYEFHNLNLHTRKGTEKDVQRLKDVFKMHSFEVVVHDDALVGDIFYVIEKAIANADHSNSDCVAVVILTHSDKEGLLYARDTTYKLRSLVEMITADKCLSLAGKPKLFFIQASRGEKADPDMIVVPRNPNVKIPSYADFLIAESTTPAYIPMKYEKEGSLFIRAINDVLLKEKSYTKSFLTLMTEVIARVAFDNQNDAGDLKQVPSITTTLTKKLMLVKK
ncbi:Hypothetical predicted protein [Cloeon dipterum]|uniref:Caspase family p20 domain-containing protein n=1 Tax=Cloeon dipterum TaxID=197152 RepID=A0A8S1C6G6_9INSE|nr:Hypothetical predicted protein [Cloeon dipterum]